MVWLLFRILWVYVLDLGSMSRAGGFYSGWPQNLEPRTLLNILKLASSPLPASERPPKRSILPKRLRVCFLQAGLDAWQAAFLGPVQAASA